MIVQKIIPAKVIPEERIWTNLEDEIMELLKECHIYDLNVLKQCLIKKGIDFSDKDFNHTIRGMIGGTIISGRGINDNLVVDTVELTEWVRRKFQN